MLTRLRNANSAYHDTVSMPSSKLKVRIANILKEQGYIASFEEVAAEVGKTLIGTSKFGILVTDIVKVFRRHLVKNERALKDGEGS